MTVPKDVMAVGAAWLVATVAGLVGLWQYAHGTGQAASAPAQWPVGSTVHRDPQGPTLVVFAHPHCPCSRASIGELDRLVAQCAGQLSVHVLFYRPSEETDAWAKTDLWRRAEGIPGVLVHVDEGGGEAALFEASVSGQVALYARDGSLVFRGGITASRGHAGDNDGRTSIVEFVTTGAEILDQTPAFGCSLVASSPPATAPEHEVAE